TIPSKLWAVLPVGSNTRAAWHEASASSYRPSSYASKACSTNRTAWAASSGRASGAGADSPASLAADTGAALGASGRPHSWQNLWLAELGVLQLGQIIVPSRIGLQESWIRLPSWDDLIQGV